MTTSVKTRIGTLLFLAVFLYLPLHGQVFRTVNNRTGAWETASNWVSNNQPNPLNTNIADEIDVYGYMTRTGSLSFANIGANTKYITIYDTLVVFGNMSFANNSINLRIASNGLLVVFGDFSSNNKVNLDNGGTLVITGNMTLTGGQNNYIDNGGGLYVDGTISGNGDTDDADAVDQPTSTLGTSSDPGEKKLFEFINGGGATPLPITLGTFTAKVLQNKIRLNWQTLSEVNFEKFEVHRSGDGVHFITIGVVKGQGFTTEPHDYVFTDHSPLLGFNYYRLNAIDFDGSFEIFKVIKAELQPDFSSVRIFPNPSSGKQIRITLPESLLSGSVVNLVIADQIGRVVMEQEIDDLETNLNPGSALTPGVYLVTIKTEQYSGGFRLLVSSEQGY